MGVGSSDDGYYEDGTSTLKEVKANERIYQGDCKNVA